MFKKFLIAIAGFIAVVAILGAVKTAQIKKMASAPHVQPAPAVATATARSVEWHSTINAVGSLAPVQGVTVSADADGIVVNIAAENGSKVKAGDLLVELDTSVERAQLAAAQARAELARINLDRAKELWSSRATAKSEFDTAEATYKQTEADVAALQAQIERKRVRAPFDGRVGIRLVNVGQFVARGRALLPLQKLDPIYVNFNIPQRQMPELALGQKVSVGIDAYDSSFDGTINAINPEVDPATRTVSAQATLANPREVLRAGMFVRVEVQTDRTESLVVVPATAISYASYGNSVFVVQTMKDKDGHEYLGVKQQFVKLGPTRGDLISITEGVREGDQVVTAGVFKLRNGAPVQVNNAVQPTSNPNPTPANT